MLDSLAQMMSQPPRTENEEKRNGANDLAGDSADKRPTDQCRNESSDRHDQRGTNVVPGIFPAKYPAQRRVAQSPLNDVRQKNSERRADRAKAGDEPE